MATDNLTTVEVVYATLNKQVITAVRVAPGTNVETVILQSGLLAQFPEIDLTVNRVGIFSKTVTLETIVQSFDRVEIYRTLLIDPKQARRNRVQKA